MPQGINACASGIPYWTSDIGGYQYHWQAPDWSKPEFRELFSRWFQFGAFCPIFRIHGKGERALFSKNWDEKTKATLLKYDKLRYRLLPYIYSLAGKTTLENYTMMRSLAFDFKTDPNIQDIPDQYMFGSAFLVNPVTAEGATSRKVYLPKTTWYNFWTGEKLNGGQTIDAAAPVEILPLYVRAGSIIPMGPEIEYATQKTGKPTEVRIYPGANGRFEVYEDENDNYNYEKGKYAIYTFTWNDNKHTLTISDIRGVYAGMPKNHRFDIVLVKGPHGSDEGVSAGADKQVNYRGKAITIKL